MSDSGRDGNAGPPHVYMTGLSPQRMPTGHDTDHERGAVHVSGMTFADEGDAAVMAVPAPGDYQPPLSGGSHALHVLGDLRASREWFDANYRAAVCDKNPRRMAEAALGLGGLWVHEHRTVAARALVQARLRQALAAVDPQSPLALRLRVRLAGEADYRAGGHTRILAVLEEARHAGDPIAR